MLDDVVSVQYPTYGAFELKKYYQKSLGMALAFASAFFMTVTLGGVGYAYLRSQYAKVPEIKKVYVITDPSKLLPPPDIGATIGQQVLVPELSIAVPKIGIPEAVADDKAPVESDFATQKDLEAIAATKIGNITGSIGDNVVIQIPQEEYMPPPGEFIPTDESPVQINEIMPEYPSLARQAGIEGTVWLNLYVDKTGRIKKALILKTSGSSAGFEDAALSAANKSIDAKEIIFKPAISNKQPVGIWVSYPIRFKLPK